MSYEGSIVGLCTKGHVNIWDCYAAAPKECCDCGAEIADRMPVDETNFEDMCRFDLRQLTPEYRETCRCCGHTHVAEKATYQFVKYGEWKSGYKILDKMTRVYT